MRKSLFFGLLIMIFTSSASYADEFGTYCQAYFQNGWQSPLTKKAYTLCSGFNKVWSL